MLCKPHGYWLAEHIIFHAAIHKNLCIFVIDFSKLNTLGNQILVGDSRVPYVGIVGKTLYRDYAVLNVPARAPLSCVKNLLAFV